MRIAFFGSSLVSAFWAGAAPCHRGRLRALARRGRCEPDAYEGQQDHDFLPGGAGWGDPALPRNVRYVCHVPTGDHDALRCGATAALDVDRDSRARFGFSSPGIDAGAVRECA